jgi:hypothetical protein
MADITQLSLGRPWQLWRQLGTLDNGQARDLSECKTNRAGARDKDTNEKNPKRYVSAGRRRFLRAKPARWVSAV